VGPPDGAARRREDGAAARPGGPGRDGPAGAGDRGPAPRHRNWGAYVLLETFDDEYRRFEGRLIGDIAAELGRSPWDTLADIAVADELRTVIANQDKGQDEASWTRRVEVWRDGGPSSARRTPAPT
jgi:hypothetical protein